MKKAKVFGLFTILNIIMFMLCSMSVLAGPKETKGESKIVHVGYYDENELFQKGASNGDRKSGYGYEFYQEVAKYSGFSYEYIYGDYETLYQQLVDGEIDIIAGIQKTSDTVNDVLFPNSPMLQIDGETYFFAVSKMRPDLLSSVNDAQRRIRLDSPFFASNLLQKYYENREKENILTKREQAWLKMQRTLKVGYIRNSMPISGQTASGEPDGIAAELIEHLRESTGIQIDALCFDNISQAMDALKQNRVDTIFPMYADIWIAEQQGLYVTKPVISDRVMLVYDGEYTDDLFNKISAGKRTIGQLYYIRDHYPDAEILFYENRKEYLDAVENGEVNCAIASASILNRYINSHAEYKNLKTAYLEGTEDFGLGVRKGESTLNHILSELVQSLDQSAITNAMIKYSNVEPEYSFDEFLKTHPYEIVGGLLIVMVILIFGCNFYFKRILKHSLEANKAWAETQKINESKNQFVQNMTQDIKASVNEIAEMLTQEEKIEGEEADRKIYHDSIKNSIDNMKTLIANATEISRLECGDIKLAEESFELGTIVESTYNGFLKLAEKAGMSMVKANEWPAYYPRLIGSPTYVRRILNQFIGNAIKYRKENGTIRIGIMEERKGFAKVVYRFIIEDDGIGMSPEFLPHVFDSFSQEHTGSNAKEYGTGLGLAITKILVEKMGGSIQADSKLGEGSRFEIEIPFKIDTEYKKNMAAKAEAHKHLSGKSILIIEDDEVTAQNIARTLTNYEMKVTVAYNGEEGAKLFESNLPGKFDVILMDIVMPVMDGLEATRYIRNIPRLDAKGIPIIAVTSHGLDEDVRKCLDAGMNAHLAKPVEAEKLFSEIAALVI